MVSSAIVASAWLQIPLSKILQNATGVQPGNIAEWRLWVAGFAVMTYLLVRYRFCAEGKAYKNDFNKTYLNCLHTKINWFIQDRADSFAKTGFESPIFREALLANVNEHLKNGNPNGELKGVGHLKLFANIHEVGKTPWDPRYSFAMEWDSFELRRAISSGPAIDIAIERRREKWPLSAWAWLHAFGYTEASTINAVPLYIGLAALVTLWSKVLC